MKPSTSQTTSGTDWDRVDALADDEIDVSDCPPLNDEFFVKAKVRLPDAAPGGLNLAPAVSVTVNVTPEVLDWFQAQGDGWEARMSAALRIYAEAHQSNDSSAA